jgi:hypothetical protein
MTAKKDVFQLSEAVKTLTVSQQAWLSSFAQQFKLKYSFERHPAYKPGLERDAVFNLVTETVLENIGDLLRIHHAMSRRALSKVPFEYAFEKALQLSNVPATLADSATHPGCDLVVAGERISLKTEASKGTKDYQIHVSKWMELGAGDWNPPEVQLPNFFAHMEDYDRILSLRCLKVTGAEYDYSYELVEIPKALLLEAATGELVEAKKTKQATTPWTCRVLDPVATAEALAAYGLKKGRKGKAPGPVYKFALYFDAGSERKLQVKAIQKAHCIVHATWKFESVQLTKEDPAEVEALNVVAEEA